jgi:hypothetical protein
VFSNAVLADQICGAIIRVLQVEIGLMVSQYDVFFHSFCYDTTTFEIAMGEEG